MPKVATVSFDLVRQAIEAANNNREVGPTLAVVMALSKKYSSDQLLAVTYRLQALANMVDQQQTHNWTMNVKGKEYTLVSQALLKAASRTPLSFKDSDMVSDISFDPEALLAVALEESETDGAA
jgi:hypothetical protein